MAKIAKITMYIYDPNMDADTGSLEEEVLYQIDDCSDMNVLAIDCDEKGFAWDDDVVINNINCTPEDVEVFFDELPEMLAGGFYLD